MSSKVLVTGGHGFIGGHVVDRLAMRGITPVIFDRYPKTVNTKYLLPTHIDKAEFFMGDIRDRNAVNQAVAACDGAINLAGILGTSETVDNPFPSAEANVMGALNFFEAVREYNIPAVQIAVGNHFMNNTYAITKATAERLALMYNKEHRTKIAVVRGLNAYGPRQKHKPVRKIIPNFVTRSLRGEPIKVYGDGKQIMDMVFVGDLAEILIRALETDLKDYGHIFEAGTGERTTVNTIARAVNVECGRQADHIEHVEMRAGETENAVVLGNPDTLRPLYGNITPQLTTLQAGLKETIAWYKKNYPWEED